ncbi:hypothetical protein ACQ7CX_17685 [Chryseobacterium arthrosphaerae]|uniref:hypothetical protein n=1 Tax=Chryseobacterium arthrosphaerae TaxID=651561 RepID=UPI001BAE6705|nr:hypothetical protein [Chryseobacterium arthrosphaerae]QUY55459.1 hypothetical protein I2F65_21810 [Chryseobacterium arthrosphaerae]
MQKLYKNYADEIAYYLNQEKTSHFQKSFSAGSLNENRKYSPKMSWLDKTKNEANFRSLSALDAFTGIERKYEEKLGSHPSFQHLKNTTDSEYHYIVSMFIDVKNSTGLFKKYTPDVVAGICRVIQNATIHTCWHFDGYVHRLQGDGLMVYFGGKEVPKQIAVENALLAGGFINYFVKNDLKNLFEEKGVNRIYTRIGIDFGDDDKTLWHDTGIGDCSEITTTSLHTSLSCKMQGQAESNGIVVGGNILPFRPDHQDYFRYKKYRANGEERDNIYEIPEDNFRYKQYDFNWERYLKNHPKIQQDHNGGLLLPQSIEQQNIYIKNNISQLEKNATGYKPYLK